MRKVELLPTRDCEAGYAPDPMLGNIYTIFLQILTKDGDFLLILYVG